MSVPAIGPVLTPPNFQVVSAQGSILLSWSQVPLGTIYYINRSTDNVTFTNIATTASLSYVSTTGDLDTIYYFQVQAGNGTNSSLPTPSLSGLMLKPGQTTVANLILESRQRCNKENSQFYTDQELVSMVSQSYKELYDVVVTAYGDDYYLATPFSYTTIQNQQMYPLPNDFYKLLLVECALNPQDPNSYVTIRQFMLREKNKWNYPNQYTMFGITNIRYRLEGDNLFIVPQTQGNQALRIWYVPRPNQLINMTDLVDGISGWEEYIVADVCIKMLVKEESNEQAQAFAQQKAAMMKRLEDMANNRNIGEPQQVTDAKCINFSWGEADGSGYGSGGMGY